MIVFDWDEDKNEVNRSKHGIDFETALAAFDDPDRLILFDTEHSGQEERWFCIGNVKNKIVTVRFTMRDNIIRIIGAGYWRKGKKRYEEKNH